MWYKNIGTSSKTFYGVSFKPGETKEVHGYINCNSFIRVEKPSPKSEPKAAPASAPKPESKPVEQKPAESKPADAKPSDTKKDGSGDTKN